MSEKLPQPTQNEEVDLGQLFSAIGRLFEKFFGFLRNTFKTLFSIVIFSLKPLVNNFKIIAIIVMVSALIGSFLERYNTPVYASDMLVKPYFSSKYRLANNVNYFNALISSNNLTELSSIFEIDTVRASELIGFDIKIGPETPNDLLKEYNDYIKEIDSSLAKDISYEDYVENRDILSGSVFSIKAKSKSDDIFKSLEKGFKKTFENPYSEKLKAIRDSSIASKTKLFKEELKRIESFQKIYLNVLEAESKNGNVSIGLEGLIPLTKERTLTREYELFKEELKIRDSLKIIEQEQIKESEYYDILSSFEDVGTKETQFINRYSIVFPIIAFIVMILAYLIYKAFKFIKNYE